MLRDFRGQPCSNKMVVWVVLVITGIVTIVWSIKQNQTGYFPAPLFSHEADSRGKGSCLSVEMRRRLAGSLSSLKRQIDTHTDNDKIFARWSLEISGVAAMLDPRLALDDLRPAKVVCPEHHDGKQFVVEDCAWSPKLSDVVSVVLPAIGWERDRVESVLRGLSTSHNLSVVVIRSKDDPKPDVGDAKLMIHDKSVSYGKAVKDAIENVPTPYVFVGEALENFSWDHSPLQRLLRVLDRMGVGAGVAGGAYRDSKGHWRHGCLQRSITNFHATFLRGYVHSSQECMQCDDVLGPLVTRTALLRSTPLREDMHGPVAWRDWYTRLTHAGYVSFLCPDVMFFLKEEPSMTYDSWRAYATRWAVQTVRSYDESDHGFSCADVRIKCEDIRKRIGWYLVPPCCKEIIMGGIALLDDFARENNLLYELRHGSVLGAVKLSSYLPWDFDQDVRYDCDDRGTWETLGEYLKRRNSTCYLGLSVDKKQLVLRCKRFSIDMSCRTPMSRSSLPAAHRNVSTWVVYGGRHVGVPANPGGVAREENGPEDLRHAQHWRVPDRPGPGSWRPCKTPISQDCLDHHPGDGSLAFSSPPKCLP